MTRIISKKVHPLIYKGITIIFFNFFILSLVGLLLRYYKMEPLSFLNYMNIVHAHSHFAFAGWGFMILSLLLYYSFIPSSKIKRSYHLLFWLSNLSAFGMLISFPIQGYALYSIGFSTIYIFSTYGFAYKFYHDTKQQKRVDTVAILFAHTSLFFLVISSIGAFGMGPIMAMGKTGTSLAYNTIYFYLHFQYNGWFIFGIIALFFRYLERNNINYAIGKAQLFYVLMVISCILGYFLSTLWTKPNAIAYIFSGVAATLQIFALILLLQIIYASRKALLSNGNQLLRLLGILVLLFFSLKILMQLASVFPVIVEWTTTSRNLIIAYLHLVMLGVFTIYIFFHLIKTSLITQSIWLTLGLYLFLIGFFTTETLLFLKALLLLFDQGIPNFSFWVFILTLFLPLGILSIFIGQFVHKKNKITSYS